MYFHVVKHLIEKDHQCPEIDYFEIIGGGFGSMFKRKTFKVCLLKTLNQH